MDRGNNVWDKEAVLRYLDEQVYTANRDVHTLLKIYYPDYAKDRHFLSYPIGQFFSAIYRLWDYDKGEIIIDSAAIKECLSSNVLRAAPGEVLLRTFCNVDILFERISTFGDFRREIASAYAANYDRVIAAKSTDAIFPLKQLSIYNKYKVAKKDILALIRAIEEINEIAAYLFALDNSRQDFINFRTHFKKLEEFLKQRDLSSASEQERLLIKALQLRLNRVKPEQSSFSGTFGDLKEGLHYYLKQDHVNFVLDEDPDMIKGRLMAALNFIDQETDVIDSSNCKIVVFTAHNATLMSFLRLFNSRYSEMGVQAVPFGTHMSRAELEESVYRFQNDPDCRVIVCDETGGEGRMWTGL